MLGLWTHPLSIRVKDKTPLLGRNSVRIQPLRVETQPLGVGTQPSPLGVEFLSNRVGIDPLLVKFCHSPLSWQ